MSERFFVHSPITGDRAALEGPEAHHLAHVMRREVGEQVILFDGLGDEFVAQVAAIRRATVELKILQRRTADREAAIRLTLAVALPKGDRQRWLVEKSVELGVAGLVPLSTQRGVAQPTDSALDRLRRFVVEASKQCGRNRLLKIAEPRPWAELSHAAHGTALRILAHSGGAKLPTIITLDANRAPPTDVIAAIGPEGGFTDEEVQAGIQGGWVAVDLGPRILRVETAAIAVAAWTGQLG